MATKKSTVSVAKSAISDSNGLLTMSNVQALNTVRRYAPNDYQQRIPVATQSNIRSVLEAMNAYTPNWDVYWNVFVGRIGRVNINDRMNFTNPLAKLKQPAMPYGRTIQEIQTNLIKAKVYDPNGSNVFGREGREPEIFQAFHTENRRDTYELNIPMEDVLRGSFIEGESISAFWNSLTAVPVQSANNDEFLLMRNLLRQYDTLSGYYNIHVDDLNESGITFEEQQHRGARLVQKMRAMYTKLKYNSPNYSPVGRKYGLTGNTPRVIAIISADVESILKTITTAYAFNEANQDIIADDVIVLDDLNIQGSQALMIDESWYQCADTLGPLMLSAPLNPQNMSYNYFYHIWQALSYSNFLGAVLFSTRPDTVISASESVITGVTLKDAQGQTGSTVAAGGAVALVAEVQGTGDPNQAVRWQIEAFDGKGAGMTLPAETYIDSYGVFHAGNTHSGDTVKITATSIYSPQHSATYTVKIDGETYATAVSASDVSIEQGGSGTVIVSITPADATDASYSAYSVDGVIGISNVRPGGFAVSCDESAPVGPHQIVVVANGAAPDGSVTDTVTVTVTAKP